MGLKNVSGQQIRRVTHAGNSSRALQALLRAIAIKSRMTIELAGKRIPIKVARPPVKTEFDLRRAEYLDLRGTGSRDISPLVSAQELSTLLVDEVDLSPILRIKRLEELVVDGKTDLTPLKKMHRDNGYQLKNVRVVGATRDNFPVLSKLYWLKVLFLENCHLENQEVSLLMQMLSRVKIYVTQR